MGDYHWAQQSSVPWLWRHRRQYLLQYGTKALYPTVKFLKYTAQSKKEKKKKEKKKSNAY